MAHSSRSPLAVLTALALSSGLLLSHAPAATAGQPRPVQITIQDPAETKASHDITRVRLYSGSHREPTGVTVTFARKPRVGDKVQVWLDTDKDRRPDYLARVIVGQQLKVFTTRSWSHKKRKPVSSRSCITQYAAGRGIALEIKPRCLGIRQMRVSVTARNQGVVAADHAPGRRTWSEKVRLFRGPRV